MHSIFILITTCCTSKKQILESILTCSSCHFFQPMKWVKIYKVRDWNAQQSWLTTSVQSQESFITNLKHIVMGDQFWVLTHQLQNCCDWSFCLSFVFQLQPGECCGEGHRDTGGGHAAHSPWGSKYRCVIRKQSVSHSVSVNTVTRLFYICVCCSITWVLTWSGYWFGCKFYRIWFWLKVVHVRSGSGSDYKLYTLGLDLVWCSTTRFVRSS